MSGRKADQLTLDTGTGYARFTTTAWTAVGNAQGGEPELARKHLEFLVARYWRPVYCLIRQFGNAHEKAKDLTQDFFTNFVERDIVSYADRNRGKFRTFLRASVKRYLAMQHRKDVRRPPPASLSDLELAAGESSFQTGIGEPPERTFDRNWAKSLLENSLSRFRGECHALGKDVRYRVFEARFLSDPESFSPYKEIAKRLGLSETAVRKHLERGKNTLARMIREEVAHSVGRSSECGAEIKALLESLA